MSYLEYGCQIWHGLEIMRREAYVVAFPDKSFCSTNFLAKFVLDLGLLAQF